MKHTLSIALLCSLFWPRVLMSHCDAEEPSGPLLGTMTLELYEFKAKSLGGKVKEAMEQGRQNDAQPMAQLMDEYSKTSVQVLRLLKPYLDSRDLGIRSTLMEAAQQAPHSAEAMNILLHLASNEEEELWAIDTLYSAYACDELLLRGGTRLKAVLLQEAKWSRYTTWGYLLLSLYPSDKGIRAFLQKRRAFFGFQVAPISPSPSSLAQDKTVEKICLDLALTEMGDASAMARIKALVARNNPKELNAFLQYLKFVRNREVLKKAIGQLQNKTVMQVIDSSEGKHIGYFLVCDTAAVNLNSQFNLSLPSYTWGHRYSDAELNSAYNQALKTLGNKN